MQVKRGDKWTRRTRTSTTTTTTTTTTEEENGEGECEKGANIIEKWSCPPKQGFGPAKFWEFRIEVKMGSDGGRLRAKRAARGTQEAKHKHKGVFVSIENIHLANLARECPKLGWRVLQLTLHLRRAFKFGLMNGRTLKENKQKGIMR